MDNTFTSDTPTASRLKNLVQSLDLPADNIGVRWAICRSLTEGPVPLVGELEGGGKELKGRTLFGSSDVAPVLLAQLLIVEGADVIHNFFREVVLAHWSRGQMLLDEELQRLGGTGEAVLIAEVDRRMLKTRTPDFEAQVIGQPKVVSALETMHKSAWRKRIPSLAKPVVIKGLPGSGRSFVSSLLARSLSDSVLDIRGTTGTTVQDFRDPIHEIAEHASVLLIENVDRVTSRSRSAGERDLPENVSLIATADLDFKTPTGWDEVQIAPYERDAVAQILRRHFGWHLEVRRMIALAGRLLPALTIRRAESLAEISTSASATDRDAVAAFERWGLDRLGLDDDDRKVLAALGASSTQTVQALASTTSIIEIRLTASILPYLKQLGLAVESKRSWSLSDIGAQTYGE
ncbi:MAG: DndE family protein [Acidimicrobiales bacterium]